MTENRASFMGLGAVPNLPHLLIVPNAVLAQWHRELRTFFKPKSLEVHIVMGNEREVDDFFSSAWKDSQTPMIFRVVLIQHSVCNLNLKLD
jgi:SNF2 family DNA or RNA helicase